MHYNELEFDSPFRVNADLTVERVENLSAPSVYGETDQHGTIYREEVDSREWDFVSGGMTGQYGYNGPVLHPSENYSDRIMRRLHELHDDYDAYAHCEVYDLDSHGEDIVGWVIIGHKHT